MLEAFFPNGVLHYFIGGLLIGLAVIFVYVFAGNRVGASSIYSTCFTCKPLWKLYFGSGLVIGGFLFFLWGVFSHSSLLVTSVSPARLLLGGVLVGFGTRLSRGCTSGHGIIGLSHFALASLVAVVTFLFTAILTAVVLA